MAVESKEVSRFTSGLVGATSETDLNPDVATFSLDVDSEFEKGAITGIKGDYILGEDGWELPRYAIWRINIKGDHTTLGTKAFLVYGYNKIFLVYLKTSGTSVPSSVITYAQEKGYTLSSVALQANATQENIADQIVGTLNDIEVSPALSTISGISRYFTCLKTLDSVGRVLVVIRSNFLGNIKVPECPSEFSSLGGVNRLTYVNADPIVTAYILFPQKEVYENVTGPNYPVGYGSWADGIDGLYVKGNGLPPYTSQENSPLGFKFLKPMNQRGDSNLFGITQDARAVLLKGLGAESLATIGLGAVAASSNIFDISAEQRNSNLFVGTGGTRGTHSLWLGNLNRTQLDVTYKDDYKLLKSDLESLGSHQGPISVDNIAVHTLHYGLNSTNGGIAGSANIYCDDSGVDATTSNLSGKKVRSLNNWAYQCLRNVSVSTGAEYAHFKEGMIFRLDLKGPWSASSHNFEVFEPGISAYTVLSNLKAAAKNVDKDDYQDGGSDASSSNDTYGGSDREVLHSGDLFQIVFVPTTQTDGSTTTVDRTALESDVDLIRFAYIGHLSGDYSAGENGDGTDNANANQHDSDTAFSGVPAYSFGHVNDSPKLYRIKNTSAKSSVALNSDTEITLYNSSGSSIVSSKDMVDFYDLSEELGIPDFKIGTISECKSADGYGNFGGDNSNTNYYMGYGKLWISNINQHDKLYLVDVSNWDGLNTEKNVLTYKEITLDFGRIHKHLFATDHTEFGKGLVRLWYGGFGDDDYDKYLSDYQWSSEPIEQYISGICETYSHEPHLGDGATTGIGAGKWRVWVSYNKSNDLPHSRWDLFLFNFRPQGIVTTSEGENFTGQTGIGTSDNYTVYMYDKTPPYQECAEITLGRWENDSGGGKVCYPFDKFAFSKNFDSDPPDDGGPNSNKDTFMTRYHGSQAKQGKEYFAITGGPRRRNPWSSYEDSHQNVNFRNPSGEIICWKSFYGSRYDSSEMSLALFLGNNIGWLQSEDGYRQTSVNRHCLKPHFKQWYFTGTGAKTHNIELNAYVAHIVNFIAKVSGKFVESGGSNFCENSSGTVAWYVNKNRKLENYSDDFVLFSQHDSPVAFASTTGSHGTDASKSAVFPQLREYQGAPYDGIDGSTKYTISGCTYSSSSTTITHSSSTNPEIGDMVSGTNIPNNAYIADVTDATHFVLSASPTGSHDTGDLTFNVSASTNISKGTANSYFRFRDQDAGWRLDWSVPATQGFSKFNQYRYAHGHNGCAQLSYDTGFDDESFDEDDTTKLRHGFINTRMYGKGDHVQSRGCSYFGQDGFGHYNMVATTWASNSEIDSDRLKARYNASEWNDRHDHIRVYGYGFEHKTGWGLWPSIEKGSYAAKQYEPDFQGQARYRTGRSESTAEDLAKIQFGTGYLSYRWPHTHDPDITTSAHNNAVGNHASERGGFYDPAEIYRIEGETSTDSIPTPGKQPSGNAWNNRKSVFCWSTTAIARAIYPNHDRTKPKYSSKNEHDYLINPRTSFRKIKLPSGYRFGSIDVMDTVSWQRITSWTSNEGNDTTDMRHGIIICGRAVDSPVNDFDTSSTIVCVLDNKSLSERKREKNDGNFDFFESQSRAAVAPVYPLLKQHKQDVDKFLSQIATYTNDRLIFKNLNPGLADSTVNYNSSPYFERVFRSGIATPYNTEKDLKLDVYSPIIIGNTGGNDVEAVSIWNRPQFNPSVAVNLLSMGDFPYYRYDRLWNYWSHSYNSPNNASSDYSNYNIEAGFDMARLEISDDQTIKKHKRPMEGWGSTAGSLIYGINGSSDNTYKAESIYRDSDNTLDGVGAHIKLYKQQFFAVDSEEPVELNDDGTPKEVAEFEAGKEVYYKFTYVYDNFQEGPLSDTTFPYKVLEDSKFLRLKVALPPVSELGLNPRVTHLNIYRKNNLKELFRLVKSIALSGEEDKFAEEDGRHVLQFNDEATTVSYEGLNGVSETLTDFTPNYSLSCQLNDFLFIADIYHPHIEEGSHILLRSKKGKFSIFDWSNDFLDLPTRPVAIASFANRIFMWDENNTYIINPDSLYIEERTEGIGILNSKSFVVTDIGMFFADRSNIYVHNGREATPIGDAILYNHSRPEWQIGYLDAIKKAETLGYTPRVIFDSIKQCVYVILQGYTDASTSNFSDSYETNKTRIYSYNINSRRWDYYTSPNVKTAVSTGQGDVVFSDGYQIYNYRVDKRTRKSFSWESKEFIMGSSNYEKAFKRLYVTGELCLWNFNNDEANAIAEVDATYDWGGLSYEETFYESQDDTHLLESSTASEKDDLKVYIDGVLQTMRVQDRKPNVGHYIANDKTGSIYTVETYLPAFETASNGLTDTGGNDLTNAFSLLPDSCPEFVEPPHSQYKKVTNQGEVGKLNHIHQGQYLLFSGTAVDGTKYKEYVKVRNIYFNWTQGSDGINTISRTTTNGLYNSIKINVFRGLLGTKAIDWNAKISSGEIELKSMNPLRVVSPVLKFPAGAKGKNVKIVFNNQKSYIDSFAITYRKKRMK